MDKSINDGLLSKITPDSANGEAKAQFDRATKQMGMIPHLFHNLAVAPKVLTSFMDMQFALETGFLDAKHREVVALRVAEKNCAGYCVSMHHYIGEHLADLSSDEMIAARKGKSEDPKTQAMLNLTDLVLENNGAISQTQLNSIRAHGVDDAEIIEVIANITWNLLANYVDGISLPAPDVPQVELLEN